MLYLIMCGGTYANWKYPKQLSMIHGEPLVARTIRLLRENGVDDIGISTNDSTFAQFGVTLYKHPNEYNNKDKNGLWVNCFYPTSRPTCYLMGDVLFSGDTLFNNSIGRSIVDSAEIAILIIISSLYILILINKCQFSNLLL